MELSFFLLIVSNHGPDSCHFWRVLRPIDKISRKVIEMFFVKKWAK